MRKDINVVFGLLVIIFIIGIVCFSFLNKKVDKNNTLVLEKITEQQREIDSFWQISCAEQAKAFYETIVPASEGKLDAQDVSHWNKNRSKCYMEIVSSEAMNKDGTKLHSLKYIYDVSSGSIVAAYGTILSSGGEKAVLCKILLPTKKLTEELVDCKDARLFENYEYSLMNN